ncbi:MAG TPA: glycosyltransferase family 39 protein [Thermoanaerobaculia bacterium]|nr:glycosyltransferase family 39 protein [Thermoanaerobaculia bacterium]
MSRAEGDAQKPLSIAAGSGVATRTILIFASAKLFLHLAAFRGYGYFRDEFYYLACARHLAPGYVDHPALSVALLWLATHLLGTSLFAVRLLPALAGAATVALVGLLCREMGGDRFAGLLAMSAALVPGEYLALDHFYSMNAFDLLFWALAGYLVVRLLNGGDPRLWLFLGLVLGLGLANKISVLWLGGGLIVAFALGPERRHFATRWPYYAGAIAAALFAPYVLWQVKYGWPTLEFIHNATSQKMVHVSLASFVAGQVDVMCPFTLPIWLGGLAFLFLHPKGRRYRILAWTYIVVFAVLAASGSSRAGYLSPAYTWLFAAGGICAETLLYRRSLHWLRWAGWGLVAVVLLGGAVGAPFALPLLPIPTYLRYAQALGQKPTTEERKELGQLPQFYADFHGWPEIVATVAGVYRRLPEADKARARIVAPDYGVAGAIDLLGTPLGLPQALSGHNNYWLWGPGSFDGTTLIVIGSRQERLAELFREVERAATIECGLCMPYENHRPVWICHGLKPSVPEFWSRIKHYD